MGTLKDHADMASIRVGDPDHTVFYHNHSTVILGFVNSILKGIYQKLVFIESCLVYAEDSILTVADIIEYSPPCLHNGFLDDGVWIDDTSLFFKQVSEADKVRLDYKNARGEPYLYFFAANGDVGFLPVADDVYTVNIQLWKPLAKLSNLDADDLPWNGIFDNVIERLLVVDLLHAGERDAAHDAVQAEIAMSSAMDMALRRGVRERRIVSSGMFTIPGV